MEELVAYDPHLVVGILGGSAGTTYDAFKLIAEAQKYGARAALVRPQDQQRRMPIGVRRVPAAHRRRRDIARGSRAGLSRRAAAVEHQAASLAGRRHATAKRRDELRRLEQRERAGRSATQSQGVRQPATSTIAVAAAAIRHACTCHDKPHGHADGMPDFSKMTWPRSWPTTRPSATGSSVNERLFQTHLCVPLLACQAVQILGRALQRELAVAPAGSPFWVLTLLPERPLEHQPQPPVRASSRRCSIASSTSGTCALRSRPRRSQSHKQHQVVEVLVRFQPTPCSCSQRTVTQLARFHVMRDQPAGPLGDVSIQGFQRRD